MSESMPTSGKEIIVSALPLPEVRAKALWTFSEKLQVFELIFKSVTVLGVICGGIGYLFDYAAKQRLYQKEMLEALKRDAADRDRHQEAMRLAFDKDAADRERFTAQHRKAFGLEQFKRKMDIYHRLGEVTAAIATAATREDAEEDIRKFKVLYYGPLCLVEDDVVVAAEEDFRKGLVKWQTGPPPNDIGKLSIDLIRSCQTHLKYLDEDRITPYVMEANAQLGRLAINDKIEGFSVHLLPKEQTRNLRKGETWSFGVVLEKDRHYRFLAAGDRNVNGLVVVVEDPAKKTIVTTEGPIQDVAVLYHCKTNLNCTVHVTLHASRNREPCVCAAAVMVK